MVQPWLCAARYALTWSVCFGLLVGCSVDPPLALEDDPRYAQVQLPDGARLEWRFALAVTEEAPEAGPLEWGEPWLPAEFAAIHSGSRASLGSQAVAGVDSTSAAPGEVAAVDSTAPGWGEVAALDSSTADVAAVGSAASAGVDSTTWSPRLRLAERPNRWSAPPSAAGLVGARLTRVCSWAFSREPVVSLVVSADDPGDLQARLLELAADERAELLIHVDLLEQQVAWVRRDGAWWWANFVLFYGPGLLPVVMIADEVYEVGLHARVSVIHLESGRPLLAREFTAVHERSLNDSERGWSLSGFFFLYPYTLSGDDYEDVRDALLPHALKELELQVVRWLEEELPPRLRGDEPEVAPGE
ncbi:MAG: hypothetical protein KDD82_11685 [Planctomycetes bacterium]|nr:hypothetical protein [Planctomycetota bacterium]